MGKKVKEYKSGDFIFAKVKGYPAWPARVQRPNGKKYFVYFYGTGETANLPPNQIFDYAENKDKFLTKTVKRKDFNDGVQQINHDFTNNVPLEEVLGGPVGEPMDTTANDTGMESANDTTMNETADNDGTANATVDESNATATPAVEDSDDGALVIDEGKKAKKQPAKATTTSKTPRGKAKKDEEKPEEEKKEEELVSRSGRKIRPKRFVDEHTEENATLPSVKRRRASPAPVAADGKKTDAEPKRQYQALTQSELEDIKEPVINADADKDHILVACLPSGQYVGIRLFQSKPTSFKNEAARLQWYRQAAANAVTLRSQLEKGHITAASVAAQIETDLNLTEEEKSNLDKEREIEEKKSRVQFLKTEMKLIELDAKVKSCLSLEKADTELCLKLIDELMELEVKSLMLLKHPTCVETLRRMRAYVGNTPSWEFSEEAAAEFAKRAQLIRKQAEKVYRRFKESFSPPPPEGLSFWEFFSGRVEQFNMCTAKLNADELLEMVNEPIELSEPSSNTMRAAIDAANSVSAETEEKDKPTTPKKRGAPAKNKKAPAAPAPSKTPKRNSARNKPQSEVEKPEDSNENNKEVNDIVEETENTKQVESENTEQTREVTSNNEQLTEKAVNDKGDKEAESESDKPAENGDAATNDVESKGEKDKDLETTNDTEVTKEADNRDESGKDIAEKEAEVTENAEKVTDNVEKATEKAEKVTKEAKKVTKATKEAEKPEKSSKEEKKAIKEAEKATKDAEKATKDAEKSEKATKEAEKADKAEGEPRAKRVREATKKEAPPPKSPLKRKAKS